MNFVSETYIKTATGLNKNIDANDIIANVDWAEKGWLRPILGKYFYNYLIGVYSAQTLSTDEEDLVELIKPAVAYRAAAESIVLLTAQVKNKGPQLQSGDFSNNVDESLMYKVEGKLRGRAEQFENDIKDWLCEYSDLYPNYTSSLNQVIMPPNNSDNFDSGCFIV